MIKSNIMQYQNYIGVMCFAVEGRDSELTACRLFVALTCEISARTFILCMYSIKGNRSLFEFYDCGVKNCRVQ